MAFFADRGVFIRIIRRSFAFVFGMVQPLLMVFNELILAYWTRIIKFGQHISFYVLISIHPPQLV